MREELSPSNDLLADIFLSTGYSLAKHCRGDEALRLHTGGLKDGGQLRKVYTKRSVELLLVVYSREQPGSTEVILETAILPLLSHSCPIT